MKAWLEVAIDGERPKAHALRFGTPVLVGRAPQRGIELPSATDLRDTHFEITAGEGGCTVRCVDGAAPLSIEGLPCREGRVAWDGDFYFDRIRLTVVRRPPSQPPAGGKPSTILLGAAALMLPLAMWGAWHAERGAARNPQADVELPLHPFAFEASCRASDAARFRATRAEEAALAEAERYAYEPRDGVRALRHFAEAEACYLELEQEENAGRVAHHADRLHRRLTHDYRNANARLRLALAQGSVVVALKEARFVSALLAHRDGPYTEWLTELVRMLHVQSTTGAPST